MIIEKKLKNLENKLINVKQCKTRVYPEHLCKPGFLMIFAGKKGLGKTQSALTFAMKYDKTRTFDHIIIYSPSAKNEKKYSWFLDNVKFAKAEIREHFSVEDFKALTADIDQRINDYKLYERRMAVYKKFMKFKGDFFDPEGITDTDLLTLNDMSFAEPQTSYKHGCPHHLVIFDDLMHNRDLFSSVG